MKKKFIVMSVEHSDDFGNPPCFLTMVDTYEEAVAFRNHTIEESMQEFPTQKRYEDNVGVYDVDENGKVNYSFIIDIEEIFI